MHIWWATADQMLKYKIIIKTAIPLIYIQNPFVYKEKCNWALSQMGVKEKNIFN